MSERTGKPRVGFVIGGAQKAGTTALAHYLARHPQVALPAGKEAHVFDAPDFDERWGVAEVDARYAPHFADAPHFAAPDGGEGRLFGDATPIYMLHPAFVRRIHRYNPAMRWIVLLRDPVDRALSQYHMERARGDETLPWWLALALERLRLAGHRDDFSPGSPLRHHSYRLRGDYAPQLALLRDTFGAQRVLVLDNAALRSDPAGTARAVQRFLGVPEAVGGHQDYPRVFEGRYQRWSEGDWRLRALRWWWWRECASMARLCAEITEPAP